MIKTIALITIALLTSSPTEFHRCDTLAKQILSAQSDYGESPAFMSQTMNGAIVIFTTNPKTNTWTMWVVPKDDPSKLCMFDGGSNWSPASEGVKSIAPTGKPS